MNRIPRPMVRLWAPGLLCLMALLVMPAWAQKSLPGSPDERVDAATLTYLTHLCEGCHGSGGVSQRKDVPTLAGRPATLSA